MLLITHVSIAIASIICAAFVLARPSMKGLYINYSMIAATLITGTWLVVSHHIQILSVCAMGLFYTFLMLSASVWIRRRLAKVKAQQ